MSDGKPVVPTKIEITQEQLDKIGGGDCTPAEIEQMLGRLKENYDTLVDFTSYVIERVAGGTT